jgi:hypothetical protein
VYLKRIVMVTALVASLAAILSSTVRADDLACDAPVYLVCRITDSAPRFEDEEWSNPVTRSFVVCDDINVPQCCNEIDGCDDLNAPQCCNEIDRCDDRLCSDEDLTGDELGKGESPNFE